jgi:hypothetical protein
MKLQIPTSKLQRNFKLQYPKCTACSFLEVGAWNFIGAWMLELGVFAVEKATDVEAWRFPGIWCLGFGICSCESDKVTEPHVISSL